MLGLMARTVLGMIRYPLRHTHAWTSGKDGMSYGEPWTGMLYSAMRTVWCIYRIPLRAAMSLAHLSRCASRAGDSR